MSSKRGFTLIEVLVSLAIFSTGMLAVVTLSSQTQLLTRAGSVRTRAALLAQEGLEAAVAEGYASLPTGSLFLDEPSLSALGDEFQYYSRQVSVQNVTSEMVTTDTDTGMKVVSATITWDDRTGDSSNAAKSFNATTIITDL